jgi:Flp pilus assembly pilin Flp
MKRVLFDLWIRFIQEEEAASLVEYALVIAVGSVVATILKPTLEQIAHNIRVDSQSEFDYFKEFGHN